MKTVVMLKAPAVCSHNNYSIPVQPGDFEGILRVLFQDVGGLEQAAVPDSGPPHSSAKLKERK
jgi:hypothetical protein